MNSFNLAVAKRTIMECALLSFRKLKGAAYMYIFFRYVDSQVNCICTYFLHHSYIIYDRWGIGCALIQYMVKIHIVICMYTTVINNYFEDPSFLTQIIHYKT